MGNPAFWCILKIHDLAYLIKIMWSNIDFFFSETLRFRKKISVSLKLYVKCRI